MSENCMVCQRIEKIKKGENPYFVKELETGYKELHIYFAFNLSWTI